MIASVVRILVIGQVNGSIRKLDNSVLKVLFDGGFRIVCSHYQSIR